MSTYTTVTVRLTLADMNTLIMTVEANQVGFKNQAKIAPSG